MKAEERYVMDVTFKPRLDRYTLHDQRVAAYPGNRSRCSGGNSRDLIRHY